MGIINIVVCVCPPGPYMYCTGRPKPDIYGALYTGWWRQENTIIRDCIANANSVTATWLCVYTQFRSKCPGSRVDVVGEAAATTTYGNKAIERFGASTSKGLLLST